MRERTGKPSASTCSHRFKNETTKFHSSAAKIGDGGLKMSGVPFRFGICVYCNPMDSSPIEYVCTDGCPPGQRIWSWRKLATVDVGSPREKLYSDLMLIFHEDPDVDLVATHVEFPY